MIDLVIRSSSGQKLGLGLTIRQCHGFEAGRMSYEESCVNG